MISRRQIIRGQQEPAQQLAAMSSGSASQQTSGASSNKSAGSSSAGSTNQGKSPKMQQPQKQVDGMTKQAGPQARKQIASRQQNQRLTGRPKQAESQQQDSSDGYVVANQYEDYQASKDYWRHQEVAAQLRQQQQAENQAQSPYRHFDPYSIYGEEDDVWYSEERLFEVSIGLNSASQQPFAH